MKSLNLYIQEKLIINKDYCGGIIVPKSFDELRKIIEQRYKEQGHGTEKNPIDFNDIDVRKIDSFYDGIIGVFEETKFEYIDISDWNISNVKDMRYMFIYCKELKLVGDLSKWDVSNVKDMRYMFCECHNLKSVGDLSKWDVSNVKDMHYMFDSCAKLESIGDLSKWDVSNVEDMHYMFRDSGITNIPNWYKE